MNHPRTVAAAALAVAALAAPAGAEPTVPETGAAYTVSASVNQTLLKRVDATCVFVPDQWTADYGPTRVEAFATTSGAVQVEIRCELYQFGWLAGDETWWATGPAVHGSASMGFVNNRSVEMCVTATALFNEQYVSTPRTCRQI